MPASAGIPITHRGVSAQVTLVSGHSASGDDLDYAHLAADARARSSSSWASRTWREIAARLIERARIAATRRQRSSRAARMPTASRSPASCTRSHELAAGLESPALLVVGDVVNVARELEAAVGLALSSRS